MTLGTAPWLHIDMGEARAYPRGGTVTGVARCIGAYVICRLAFGDAVVMALKALVRRYAGVAEKCNSP